MAITLGKIYSSWSTAVPLKKTMSFILSFSMPESHAVWDQYLHLAFYGNDLILENTWKMQSFVHLFFCKCVHLFPTTSIPLICACINSFIHLLALCLFFYCCKKITICMYVSVCVCIYMLPLKHFQIVQFSLLYFLHTGVQPSSACFWKLLSPQIETL